jgi:hypothetical protein
MAILYGRLLDWNVDLVIRQHYLQIGLALFADLVAG